LKSEGFAAGCPGRERNPESAAWLFPHFERTACCRREFIEPHGRSCANGWDGTRNEERCWQGCSRVYIDGSFATSKEFPGDWDACWDPANVDVDQLNELVLDNSPGGVYRQKQFLLGELHPSSARATAGHTFLEFFQVSKQDGRTKGIVLLDPREAIR
jgi:hypothetical protein